MINAIAALVSAIWLGILTSLSPCPLATNIAAISFLAKRVTHPRAVFISGLFYSLGRTFAYTILGYLIIRSFFSVPALANFLQKYMNKALGPVLVIAGLFLLGTLRMGFSTGSLSEKRRQDLAESGVVGAFLLGLLFALSFCPSSAALFFGSLIPLALKSDIGTTLPFFYGFATALPVLAFSIAIALGFTAVDKWFKRVIHFEKYARKITGIIFILAGLYNIYIWIILPMRV